MRHLYWLLFCSLAFSLPGQAQIIRGIGVKLGPALATQTIRNLRNNQPVYDESWNQSRGNSAALSLEWLNFTYVSLVTDFGFAEKGSTLPNSDVVDSEFTSLQAQYAYAQALLKARFPIGLLSPYVAAGPRVDLFLDQSSRGQLSNSDFNRLVPGGTLAAGLELKILRVKVMAEAQYHLDFQDSYSLVQEQPGADRLENTIRNRAFLLQAGLMILLKN